MIFLQTLSSVITVNPEIQFGKPVFKGTGVAVQSLFWHLEKGISIDSFLEDFPSVTKEQTEAVAGCKVIFPTFKLYKTFLLLSKCFPVCLRQ
jgi:uncharacterized protein (DUF433 family)